MKIINKLTVGALTVMLLVPMPLARAFARNRDPRDDCHKLQLRVYFEKFAGSTANFGDQFTLGGTVARFESPNERIGTFAIHFVVTDPQTAEAMLYGVLNLPGGQISFTGLSPTQEPRIPGPITGGTGIYKNAKGQVAHQSFPNGVEELILTFNGPCNPQQTEDDD
jgi:hypothetical protein